MTEQEARSLRDTVYIRPISDEEWENCRDNWMRPDSIEWLQEQAAKMKAKGKQ